MEKEFIRLINIMKRLRGKNGCPWDREQNHETILRCLVEECYEFYDAVIERDYSKMCEELGDIMLQIVFHSQIAKENRLFNIKDVLKSICDKLERRHPHVFSNTEVKNSNEVLINWEKIKKVEKEGKNGRSVLDNIPKALPALLKAFKTQKRVARVGFDWKNVDPVLNKILEEINELKAEIEKGNTGNIKGEIGDVLFSVVNLARHLKIDPEEALNTTNKKFEKRFKKIEKRIEKQGKKMDELSLEELDNYWEEEKLKSSCT